MIQDLADPPQTLSPDAAPGLVRDALVRLQQGDRAASLPADWPGAWGEIAAAFNGLARQLRGAGAQGRRGASAQAALHAEELLVQSQSLAHELQKRQRELQQTNEALQEKARQVAQASRYKSEFLANMSHELRTPLNSLLILSDQLSRNAEGNLSLRQVEFARTIHASGNDLLMLINDILDLSKIESGTVAVDVDALRLADLQRYMERTFRHVAEARGVEFRIEAGRRLPVALLTDVKRLQQILKNLLSNAFKFTPRGQVQLTIELATGGWSADHPTLRRARRVIAFCVADTGIGICGDKQRIIFEAFQQADGSTSRKYGGTGLGLAISRELARLLGGEIRLVSAPGQGSAFTLFLPLNVPVSAAAPAASQDEASAPPLPPRRALRAPGLRLRESRRGAPRRLRNVFRDDRNCLREGDALMLIAHADMSSVRSLLEAARAQGFKALATRSGADALDLASRYPPSAAVLGPRLDDMDGLRLLRRLQHHPDFRHLPVSVLDTGVQANPADIAPAQGYLDLFPDAPPSPARVIAHLRQRALGRPRRILVALREAGLRRELLALLRDEMIQPMVVRGIDRLLATVRRERFDTALIDAAFFGTDGERLRQALAQAPGSQGNACLPVVVYTGAVPVAAATATAARGLAAPAWEAGSAAQLLDQALRGLCHPLRGLPEDRQALVLSAMADSMPLTGKRALIVDDDMRNIFALATVLEEHGMDIVWADNGHDAIERMRADLRIDIVLMDIMMPELDGLATLRELRRLPRGREVPLVAVTAKAMKGDREKCTAAGAWDYLAKPVQTQDLLAVLRAWLHP